MFEGYMSILADHEQTMFSLNFPISRSPWFQPLCPDLFIDDSAFINLVAFLCQLVLKDLLVLGWKALISSHREWFQRMEKMNFSMVQRLGKTWWNVVETSWTETWWECGEYKQKSTGKTETRLNCMERRATSNLFVKDLRVPCIMILKHLLVKQVKELKLWNGNVVETLQMRS